MNKKDLSDHDRCTQFITPAVTRAGWDVTAQIREEISITQARLIMRGKLTTCGVENISWR